MKTNCQNCNKEFEPRRADAKFCSSSCRSLFWQNNKSQIDAGIQFQMQLKGVIDDNPAPIKKIISEEIVNKEYSPIYDKLKYKCEEVNRLNLKKQMLAKELQRLNNNEKVNIPLVSAGAGGLYGYSTSNINKNKTNNRLSRTLIGIGLGLLGGAIIDEMSKKSIENKRQEDINKINVNLNSINVKLALFHTEIDALKALLSNTKQFLTVEKEVFEKPEDKMDVDAQKQDEINDNYHQPNVYKQLTLPAKTIINVNTNSKIISSVQLTEMEYQALNFKGKWKSFFGNPSTNFHCAIHGMPGEGKSTFSIQFAHYLADNFGMVIYVSGEEGFAKTMKDKFINNNAVSPNLFLADLRSFQDLINEIKANIYNFIFIDSLDNMRIGAIELKEIRKNYSNSVLITISQSTKDGKMRGSNEIVHDSDIAVSVTDGVASTTKNRFLEKGRTYEIFEKAIESGIILRNTVRG